MSRRRENNYSGGSSGDIMSWVVVFICLVAFWPVGLFLLLRKISFGTKSRYSSSGDQRERYRQKYQPYWQRAQTKYEQYAQRYRYYQQGGPQKPGQAGGSGTPSGGAQAGGTAQGTGQQGGSSPAQQKPYQSQRSAGQPYYAANPGQSTAQGAYSGSSAAAGPGAQGTAKGGAADKKKNPAKGLAMALTALSIVLGILGVVFLSSGLGGIAAAGVAATSLGMTIFGGFSLLGALITTILRGGVLRQVRRFTKFAAVIGDRDVVSVSELAKAVGEPVKKTRKGLEDMLESGYYGEAAYIDGELDSFVTSREAADKAHGTSAGEDKTSSKTAGSENQYVAIVNELHMLCGQTSDPAICAKIERIEMLTVKIFRIVEDAPEKAPQLRRFMNYYLPTTLKLLHSYQTLERQGIDGENITAAKQDIERILDTLAAGFEQQLDNLFKSDKLDISADIDVIENLMQQDGLSGDGGIMRTAGGR